mgnify:CR=1 FL=1
MDGTDFSLSNDKNNYSIIFNEIFPDDAGLYKVSFRELLVCRFVNSIFRLLGAMRMERLKHQRNYRFCPSKELSQKWLFGRNRKRYGIPLKKYIKLKHVFFCFR